MQVPQAERTEHLDCFVQGGCLSNLQQKCIQKAIGELEKEVIASISRVDGDGEFGFEKLTEQRLK